MQKRGYKFLLLCVITLLKFLYTTQQKISLLEAGEKKFIIPKIYEKTFRVKREIVEGNVSERITTKFIEIGDWLVKLDSEDYLFLGPRFVVEWVNSNNSRTLEKLYGCTFHTGSVQGLELSQAVVTLCGSLVTAFLSVGVDSLFVEPVDEVTGKHVLYTR